MPHGTPDPAADDIQLRPVIKRTKASCPIARLVERACTPRIGRQLVDRHGTQAVRNLEFRGQPAVVDVLDQPLGVLVAEFESPQQAAGIAGKDEAAVPLDGEAKQRIAPRLDLGDVIDVIGMAVGPADDLRHPEIDVSRDRSIDLATFGIAIDPGIEDGHDPALHQARIVLQVLVDPHPVRELGGRLASPGERDHLGLARRPAGAVIEILFVGDQHVAPAPDHGIDIGAHFVPLPDGNLALIIGDVIDAGKSVLAAERRPGVARDHLGDQRLLHFAPCRVSMQELRQFPARARRCDSLVRQSHGSSSKLASFLAAASRNGQYSI